MAPFPLDWILPQFPGLRRQVYNKPAVFFDGPAGSQVPQRVIDAMSHYLAHTNANHGGAFPTALESDAMLAEANRAVADLLGAGSPSEIVFGPNMTSLTFALGRSLARTWSPGDEVVVTRLDHDANVWPWELAAKDAGATVKHAGIRVEDGTLDLDDLRPQIGDRTRLVCVGAASNLLGTINPVAEISKLAHDAGALLFVDAVHYAPHGLIDVTGWGCDFLCCSPYKFFGPHLGVLWARAEMLEELPAYKVRPAPNAIPDRWMTGTQNHEGIAGTLAAVEYLADLGRRVGDGTEGRRVALTCAYDAIEKYERQLCGELLRGLNELPGVRVLGIADPDRVAERTPTVSFTHAQRRPDELAEMLAEAGIFSWAGNSYALPPSEALGLEPDGALRVGLLHYNRSEEVRRLLDCLRPLST